MRIGIPLVLLLTGTLFVVLVRADMPAGWPLPVTAPSPPPVAPGAVDQELQDKVVLDDASDWLYGSANAAANRKALATLQQPVREISAEDQGFEKVLNFLRTNTDTNILVNWKALEDAGIDRNTQVTVELHGVPFYKILNVILRNVGGETANLGWTLDSGIVTISTRDDLNSATYQVVRMYDIRDLLVNTDPQKSRDDEVREIVELIKSVVAPDSWRDAGGTIGSIRELRGRLIINQLSGNHYATYRLLEKLRVSEHIGGRGPGAPRAPDAPNLNMLSGRTYETGK